MYDLKLYSTKFFNNNKRSAGERAPFLMQMLVDMFAPKSVCDFGCAVGQYLKKFIELGVEDVQGIEGSPAAFQQLVVDKAIVLQHDLRLPLDLGRTFDLGVSVEVIEHLEPKYEDVIWQTIAKHSKHAFITASVKGQGGPLHWNERPRKYWIDKCGEYGLSFDDTMTKECYKQVNKAINEKRFTHFWRVANMYVFHNESLCKEGEENV